MWDLRPSGSRMFAHARPYDAEQEQHTSNRTNGRHLPAIRAGPTFEPRSTQYQIDVCAAEIKVKHFQCSVHMSQASATFIDCAWTGESTSRCTDGNDAATGQLQVKPFKPASDVSGHVKAYCNASDVTLSRFSRCLEMHYAVHVDAHERVAARRLTWGVCRGNYACNLKHMRIGSLGYSICTTQPRAEVIGRSLFDDARRDPRCYRRRSSGATGATSEAQADSSLG